MTLIEKITLWQTVFTGAAVLIAGIAAWLAYIIGKQQIKINEVALKITDFSEVFLMPQAIILKQLDGTEKIDHFNILIKYVSPYPIYLISYSYNNIKTEVGGSAIPHYSDCWYATVISPEIQSSGNFVLVVEFETYMGKKYRMKGTGRFNQKGWEINTSKRIEIKS